MNTSRYTEEPRVDERLTDDEEDYDAEEPEKKYHQDLSSRIKEKAYRRLVKTGIPRRPGFYQLQTCHSMANKPSGHYYNGKHWEMAQQSQSKGSVAAVLRPLERTTRRLTICAVNQAANEEQRRRSKDEAREMQLACRILLPLQKEFKNIIALNEEEQKQEEEFKKMDLYQEKDCVMAQLLHFKDAKRVDNATEEERQRRMSIMSELTDDEKSSGDASFREMLRSLSQMSKLWKDIQDELSYAVTDLEEVHVEEEHAVGDIFNELKDEFVLSFKRATFLMKFHMAEENERQRRVNEARLLESGQKQMDKVTRRSSYNKEMNQQELMRVFNGILMSEHEKEAQDEYASDQRKLATMEEMLRRNSIKVADHACAEERARRLQEADEEMRAGIRIDSLKERIKDVMVDVQEQMLLQIFRGHKIRVTDRREDPYDQEETAQDRKLRSQRLQSRRKSCVVSGY
ncbi:uncharacterized protein LOC117288527 isoform X1 [Asterias rubens]|uniref:uncharacterized protein LOC117288527 isoform X1 n=3 Tax=Asterias rubens TaxID=7604 RepID=UPI00145544D2|nr:uncharacterized protein LOC117288527 isoform X1 [Asterias rubens]